MSNKISEFNEPIIGAYQECLDYEKVDCDSPFAINIMMHEALKNADKLEDVKFSSNYLGKFDRYFLDITIVEVLSLFCSESVTMEYLDFHNENIANMPLDKMLFIRFKDIYNRFEMEMPTKKEILSFSNYILNNDEEKHWCKLAMFRTCVSKEIKFSLLKGVSNNDSDVTDFLGNFKDLNIAYTQILEACFGDYSDKLQIWITETLTRLWFRYLKYGSLENSEFVFKSKLSWLHRRIPDWSKTLEHNKEKICFIQPESILENSV